MENYLCPWVRRSEVKSASASRGQGCYPHGGSLRGKTWTYPSLSVQTLKRKRKKKIGFKISYALSSHPDPTCNTRGRTWSVLSSKNMLPSHSQSEPWQWLRKPSSSSWPVGPILGVMGIFFSFTKWKKKRFLAKAKCHEFEETGRVLPWAPSSWPRSIYTQEPVNMLSIQ